jgi:subtilisin family serine protease
MKHSVQPIALIITSLLFCGLFVVSFNVQSQQDPDFRVSPNMGQIQALPLEQIINRTGIRAWRDADYSGQGVRIGVLHQSFGGLGAYIAGQENVTLSTRSGTDLDLLSSQTSPDGTHALQTIHTIAPQSEFYVCQYNTLGDFSRCVDWMLVSNVQLIYHGNGVLALSNSLDTLELEVERALRSNILWINAAGDFETGYIEATFDSETPYHQFQQTNDSLLPVKAVPHVARQVTLSWSDNTVNLDLEITDGTGGLVAVSEKPQNGNPGDEPLETLFVPAEQSFSIRIRNVDGDGFGETFVLAIAFASIADTSIGQTIITPGTSHDSLTIGSLQGNRIAPYSSRGPLPSGGIKPDFVTIGEIQLTDTEVFVGSSASAAIVTGAAALVFEANPSWSAALIKNYLRESATQDDSYLPGFDSVYGMGRLFLPQPPIPLRPTLPPPDSLLGQFVFIRDNILYIHDVRGDERQLITTGGSYEPDIRGDLIVFASVRNDERLDIYTYNLDTETEQRLTDDAAQDRHPSISPSGQDIAFTSNRDGNWEIYIISVDGTNEQRITNSPASEYAPTWSPDGRFLAYQSTMSGNDQLYIHELANGRITQLTNGTTGMVGAVWSPDGRYIAAYTLTDVPHVMVVDRNTGTLRDFGEGIVNAWLDHERLLLHRRDENETNNVYLLNITTQHIQLLLNHGSWAVGKLIGDSGRIEPTRTSEPQPTGEQNTPAPVSPTATTLPITAVPPADRQRALRIYPSIWSLTEYEDMDTPGSMDYIVEVEADQGYRLAFLWCGDNPDDLRNILQPLTVEFRIDDIPLTDTQVQRTTLDGVCEIWETILSDWTSGEVYRLEIYYHLREAIGEGRDVYESGDYYQRITVQVR